MKYVFMCPKGFKHGPLMYLPFIRDLEEYVEIEIRNEDNWNDFQEDDIVLIGSRDTGNKIWKGVTFLLDHVVLPSNGLDFCKVDYEVVSSEVIARLYENWDIAPRVQCYSFGYFRFDSLDMSVIERDTAFVYLRGVQGLSWHDEWALQESKIKLLLEIVAERFKQVYAVYHMCHTDNPHPYVAKNIQWVSQGNEWDHAFNTAEYFFGDYTSLFCMVLYDPRRKVFRYDYSFKPQNKAVDYFHQMLNECVYPFTEINLKHALNMVVANDVKRISRIEWSSRLYGIKREKVVPKIGKKLLELGEYYGRNYRWV